MAPTLEWIYARCIEDGDCLLWQGGTNASGSPIVTYRNEHGKKPTMQVRRRVWELTRGPIPQGKLIAANCTNPRCLVHLEQTTKSEVVRRQWQMPDTRARKTAAATAASRARGRASIETAREIRASDETLEVVAQRAGISISTASLIRRGLRWAETRNPFAGLMSGNSG